MADGGETPSRPPCRAAAWLYGQGGVVDKLQRDVYRAGMAKLHADDGLLDDANREYVDFVRALQPEELGRVRDDSWQ